MRIALGLIACVLLAILVDRACLQPSSPAQPTRAAANSSAPSGLASGACQSLAPTGTSRGRTVFLDPGHGGPDPGVTSTQSGRTIRESTYTLAIAQELARQLRADGYSVVLSRSQDSSVVRFTSNEIVGGQLSSDQVRQDLQARVRCANAAHANVLLSIHLNGYVDGSIGGSQTFYDTARPFASENERLAGNLQSAMASRLGLDDRGATTDDDLQAPAISDRAGSYGHLLVLGPAEPGWLDEPATMPGALVEPLFLTNRSEAALATSANGQRRIASALAAGLETYLKA